MKVPAGKAHAEDMAERMGVFMSRLPEGMGFVGVLFTVGDPTFEAILFANYTPEDFVPVLRAWLDRYDAGKAS